MNAKEDWSDGGNKKEWQLMADWKRSHTRDAKGLGAKGSAPQPALTWKGELRSRVRVQNEFTGKFFSGWDTWRNYLGLLFGINLAVDELET